MADAAVKKFLSKTPNGKSGGQFREWVVTDLNDDGKSEIVLVWTPMKPTNKQSHLTVFSRASDGYKPVSTKVLIGEARLSSVTDGLILVDLNPGTYAPGDPILRPTVKQRIGYRWSKSGLSQTREHPRWNSRPFLREGSSPQGRDTSR
jgi:hypothetical protein